MHVLFMAQCYAPEDVSAAVIITELANDLVEQGIKVSVITGAPNYPYGKVFEGYRNHFFSKEYLSGVQVIRTWSYISPKKTFWPRIFHYGTYSLTSFYGGLLASKPDIIVSYSPPLTLGISAWLLSRVWKVPWILQLEDIYPDAAVAADVLNNQRAISFFSAMELFQYKRASHISLISQSFKDNLLGKSVPEEKISLIPVWADPAIVRPLDKENSFRKQHGLTEKFVIMYAGNLGLTSCLEDVLSAAKILKEDPEIIFVIIGEGVKKKFIEEGIQQEGLTNIRLLPYQPREVFPEMMAAADLSIVTLNQNSSLSSLPSKTFNIMASARPILAIAPGQSEIANIVHEAACGVVIPPGCPEQIVSEIRSIRYQADLLKKMGGNGRLHLEEKYSRSKCVNLYKHMLQNFTKRVA